MTSKLNTGLINKGIEGWVDMVQYHPRERVLAGPRDRECKGLRTQVRGIAGHSKLIRKFRTRLRKSF